MELNLDFPAASTDADDMPLKKRRSLIKDESHQTQSLVPDSELLTRLAQLKELWEKKDREIRCLVEALELGNATGKMFNDQVQPLITQCFHTDHENARLLGQINDNEATITELQERCYSFRTKLSAMLTVSDGCKGNDIALSDCPPPYGWEGNDIPLPDSCKGNDNPLPDSCKGNDNPLPDSCKGNDNPLPDDMYLKECIFLSTVAMTLMKCASLSADAEKALKECCTLPQVSDLSAVPDERLLSEIRELHSENYEAKSSPKTSEEAVQQSEESLKKMDQEVKLMAELLRRNQDKFALEDARIANLCTFQNNFDKILKRNACLKRKLDGTVRVLADMRKRCSTYLEELSVNLSAFRDEIGGILSRHDKTAGPENLSQGQH